MSASKQLVYDPNPSVLEKDDETEELPCDFNEAYYYSVNGQGNIYSLAPLTDLNGTSKFLVASLKRKVFCLESAKEKPNLFEVLFPLLPSLSDIVSIDAFFSPVDQDFIIGITFVKEDQSGWKSSFNIYPSFSQCCSSNFSNEIPVCIPINLDFVPYHLYHTYLNTDSEEIVWLLSGGDGIIHLFKSCHGGDEMKEFEEPHIFFPEFAEVPGITLNINIHYDFKLKSRNSATCGEGGNVYIFSVALDEASPVIKYSRVVELEYPISSVKIFTQQTLPVNPFPFLTKSEDPLLGSTKSDSENKLSIAVASTLQCSFCQWFDKEDTFPLPSSSHYDAVTCCLVADVDFDGFNEVILGTFGQTILIYKYKDNKWLLIKTIETPSPIYSMYYEDLLGDGDKQLIVQTMAGLHVYQHNPEKTANLILERLKNYNTLHLNYDS